MIVFNFSIILTIIIYYINSIGIALNLYEKLVNYWKFGIYPEFIVEKLRVHNKFD